MKKILAPTALAAASVFALAGCAASSSASDGDKTSDADVTLIASTNVYGDIAAQIGGDLVNVQSVIDSAAKDPHSYEATAQDRLTVQKADVIVENGGGYDSFMESLREGSDADVIEAAKLSAAYPEDAEDHDHEHAEEHEHGEEDHADHEHGHEGHHHIEGFNEHVWYDPEVAKAVASEIAEHLSEALPDSADEFQANLDSFTSSVDEIETSLKEIAADHEGDKVFVTEPVPLYFTEVAGLENVTPGEFSESVEEGQDVPPATMLESLDLLKPGTTSVVIVNAQTGGPETDQVTAEAEKSEIPVISFTETLPDGDSYLDWMTDNAKALADALK